MVFIVGPAPPLQPLDPPRRPPPLTDQAIEEWQQQINEDFNYIYQNLQPVNDQTQTEAPVVPERSCKIKLDAYKPTQEEIFQPEESEDYLDILIKNIENNVNMQLEDREGTFIQKSLTTTTHRPF